MVRKPLLTTDFLDRARRHYADEEAVLSVDETRYTYAELGERVDRFSAALRDRGIEKGDRVAVLDGHPLPPRSRLRRDADRGGPHAAELPARAGYELREREWDGEDRMVGEGDSGSRRFSRRRIPRRRVRTRSAGLRRCSRRAG